MSKNKNRKGFYSAVSVPSEESKPTVIDPIPAPTAAPAPQVSLPYSNAQQPDFGLRDVPMIGDRKTSVIGSGMTYNGNMSIEGSKLYIYGRICGDIVSDSSIVIDGGSIVGNVTCGSLSLSEKSSIEGDVSCVDAEIRAENTICGSLIATGDVTCNGEIRGDKLTVKRLMLGNAGRVQVNTIQYARMSVKDGAVISGTASIFR